MKNSIRLSVALCLGITIGSASNAFAAIGDIVEAQFAKFTIIVDGEEQTLEADPLVYQGSTYLPVRVFANMLGRDVVFKQDSRTIELNTPKVMLKEADLPVYDFSSQKPELIYGTIQAMEETLKTETNPDTIAKFMAYIDGGKIYLQQIGWEYKAPPSELELQLIKVNRSIDVFTDMLNSMKQHEELMNDPSAKNLEKTLEELQTEKTEIEAKLRNQKTPAQ